MGFYIRKRARLIPGVWLNLGKNGLSLSYGIGMFRYRKRLTGKRKKKEVEEVYIPPEPTTGQYVGCAIYIVGLIVLLVGMFAGFFVTGLCIFIGCIVIGSMVNIIGKRPNEPETKIVEVTDENSLNEAVANLNAILELMDKDSDENTLSEHYQSARNQMAKLPPTLELNGKTKSESEATMLSYYADKLKSIKQGQSRSR